MAGFDDLLALRESQSPGSPGTSNPAPETSDPFDTALAQREGGSGRLRASVAQGIKIPELTAANHAYLSKVTGIPLEAVKTQEGTVEAMVKFRELNDLAQTSPAIKERLLTPDFVAQVHKDTSAMSQIIDGFVNGAKYFVGAPGASSTLGGDIKAAYHGASSGFAGMFGGVTRSLGTPLDFLDNTSLPGGNPLHRLSEGFMQIANSENAAKKAAEGKSATWLGGAMSGGVQSFIQNAPAMLLAVLPGGQAAALTAMSANTGGQSYQKDTEKGIGHWTAMGHGLSDAVIEAGTEMGPLAGLVHNMKAGTPLFTSILKNAWAENKGEQIATVLQDLNDWAVDHEGKTFGDYLKARPEAAAQTAIAVLVGAAGNVSLMHGVGGITNQLGSEQQKQEAATAEFDRLTSLLKAASDSSLRKNNPSTFAEVTQQIAEENKDKGAPTEVRFDARTIGEVLNQEELAQLPSVKAQLESGKLLPGDEVTVPIGELLSQVAGTPLEQKLMEHARIGENEYSQAEAKEASSKAEEFLAQESKRVISESADSVAHQQSADKVKQVYLDQFTKIGRFTKDVNEINAIMVSNMYVALGARMGLTPEEAQKARPLNVVGVNPATAAETLQQGNQDGPGTTAGDGRVGSEQKLGTTVAGKPAAEGWSSATRISRKGEPILVHRGAAEALKSDHFKPGSLGKASGNPSSGLGVWFTTGKGEASTYGKVESLHLDIRNPKIIKAEDMPGFDSVQEAHAYREELRAQGYDGIIVTAKHLGKQETHVVAFDDHQAVHPGVQDKQSKITETQAFKEWFGDSKVVDADGKPLVVYHGTNADIEEFGGYEWAGWFSANPELAGGYPRPISDKDYTGPNVMPVYLSIKNPLRIEVDMNDNVDAIKPLLRKLGLDDNLSNDYGRGHLVYRVVTSQKFAEGVHRLGYDGIIVKEGGVETYAPSQPTQIKSATGNNGNFDARDPSINKQRVNFNRREALAALLGAVTPEAKADPRVLSDLVEKQMPASVASILRGNTNGLEAATKALDEIIKSGPAEMKALAQKVKDFLPTSNFTLTVDDTTKADAHGAVSMKTGTPTLTLYTAKSAAVPEGRLGLTYGTFLHELLHMGVAARYGQLDSTKATSPAIKQLNALHSEFQAQAEELRKGVTDEETLLSIQEALLDKDEFFVRALTDNRLQQVMASVEYKGKTLLQKFADWVKTDLLGLKAKPSWLDAALTASTDLVNERAGADFGKGGGTSLSKVSKGMTVEAYHYSKAERPLLDTNHYGTGLKGSGRETYQNASDKRLGKRLSFYVDKGTGVRPEAGVGGIAHKAQLSNIYDANTDPLRLKKGSQTDFETRVLDAGYSGYLDRMSGEQPGQVILLGDQTVKPEVLGPRTKIEEAQRVPDAGPRVALGRDVVLDALRADSSLPAGSAPLSRWKEILSKDPAVLDAFERAGVFNGDLTQTMYKSELFKSFESKTPDPVYKQDDKVAKLAKIEKHLTDKERGKLNKATAGRLVDYFDSLPHADEFAAVAWAGRAKRGWYKESAKAIGQVFGPDAPRFVGLLAAMSPQNPVQTNLLNSLHTWKNWVAAGRPQTREEIVKVMGASVEGSGGVDSVLDAWINNSVRALTTENPGTDLLSGPKVDSFMRNLLGNVNEVTNDAWMANFALVDQKMFKGSLNSTDAGKGPGYLAMNAKVRQAAKILTEKTGETWTPAEVQETIWSWAKTLYEAQTADKSATDILMDESLTDDMLRSTPDFKGLFHDAKYEAILRDAGLGDRLSDLDSGAAATEVSRAGRETAPFVGVVQGRHENRAAKRLEILRRDGKPGGDVLNQATDGNLVNIGLNVEGGAPLTPAAVLDALKAIGVTVETHEVHESNTEPTVVAKLDRPLTPEEAHALSVTLKQQAIAQLSDGEGGVHGPMAEAWSPFNPEFFLLMDGTKLSDADLSQPGGSRGTYNPKTLTISLLENADLSTFHHEMGHFYLDALTQLALDGNTSAASDMTKVLKWFGVSDLASWNTMSLEEKRQFHEKFAEHYELYLFEGRAPSKEMHGIFQRFSSWMKNVYRSLQDFMKAHNSDLTDEVRGVYDRMLATEAQIEETEAARKMTPLFTTAEEAGMEPDEWTQYQLAAQNATEDAIEKLQARSLRDLKWSVSARNKAIKAVTKDVEAKRKAVEAEVRAEVEQQPVYVAKDYLDSLKGERNDADIQFMSEQLGYTSPDQMLRAIAEAQPIKHVIEGMTDQRLLERYGDLTTPKGIERAADEAIHNEARANFVATELRALEDGVRLKSEPNTKVLEKLKECIKA